MLFITRKKDQRIIIDDNVELEIIDVGERTVKLGFKFPEGHSVWREEIFNKLKLEEIRTS